MDEPFGTRVVLMRAYRQDESLKIVTVVSWTVMAVINDGMRRCCFNGQLVAQIKGWRRSLFAASEAP